MPVYSHKEGRNLTKEEAIAIGADWTEKHYRTIAEIYRVFLPACSTPEDLNMFLGNNRIAIDVMAVHRPDLWRELRDITREHRSRLNS